jgi:hypothetical protein
MGVNTKYTDVEIDEWLRWSMCDEQGWAYLHALDMIALHCRELDDKSFIVQWDTGVSKKSALLWRLLIQRGCYCSARDTHWVQNVRAVQIYQNRECSRRQTQSLVEDYIKAERREARRRVHEDRCKEEKRRLFPVSPDLL